MNIHGAEQNDDMHRPHAASSQRAAAAADSHDALFLFVFTVCVVQYRIGQDIDTPVHNATGWLVLRNVIICRRRFTFRCRQPANERRARGELSSIIS